MRLKRIVTQSYVRHPDTPQAPRWTWRTRLFLALIGKPPFFHRWALDRQSQTMLWTFTNTDGEICAIMSMRGDQIDGVISNLIECQAHLEITSGWVARRLTQDAPHGPITETQEAP